MVGKRYSGTFRLVWVLGTLYWGAFFPSHPFKLPSLALLYSPTHETQISFPHILLIPHSLTLSLTYFSVHSKSHTPTNYRHSLEKASISTFRACDCDYDRDTVPWINTLNGPSPLRKRTEFPTTSPIDIGNQFYQTHQEGGDLIAKSQ